MTAAPSRRSVLHRSLHAFTIRPRLIAGIVVGVGAGLLSPASFEVQSRLLVGWNTGVALYLATTWTMMSRSDVHELRQRAARHDEGEWTIILLAMAATLSSLAAIGAELLQAGAGDPFRLWRAGIAAVTILMSWLFVHTIMAQHYAHDYYLREGYLRDKPGLIFPDRIEEPDYWDFAYFAFTIGVASQTADIAIASPRIRRVALAHSVLAFFFNTAVLALAINVGASLL
ncbi:hypothetical protein ANOBCDAF_03659 [Pleomorphomonas sp. T1.2MG-36]|uniref:DUF1345 domain-containing protein n=1 Tax=Pleomorphomonas sp. T1.2MG-36 TaxID=3041167 RepID=UPI002477759C|nr:DUF1345 domain-containing protein [Pleomorphomonas sp. T1.2MG-36]CAI9416195.1 hypothetical protein ANOBCDAF_03659 [Pleomorphomonas sp. T1.2MG-36]